MPSALMATRPSRGPHPPRHLAGLRIVRELGRSDLGVVYLARPPAKGQHIALKVLTREVSADPRRAVRCIEQVLAAARLAHGGILPVHDARQVAGMVCVVMPYLPNGSLDDLLRTRPLPAAEAAMVGSQIAGALGIAHRAGLVHGDLRPSNILLDRDGMPSLSDFGMATLAGAARLAAPPAGVAEYLAPELSRGGDPTMAADIYALGVALWEALSGRPPFHGRDPADTMARHRFEPVPALPEPVPPDLAGAIRKALAKPPGERFADAGTFADALARSTPSRRPVRIGTTEPAVADTFPSRDEPSHDEPPAANPEAPSPTKRPDRVRTWSALGPRRHRVSLIGVLAAAVLAAAAVLLPSRSPPALAPGIGSSTLRVEDLPSSVPHATAPAAPTIIRIPSIGVNAPVVPLALAADGTVPTPSEPATAGWITASPVPGAIGPSVIVGHLDSWVGPAVFWRLSQLQPGEVVTIQRADNTSVDFGVSKVASYPADAFPNAHVYGATPVPELRLISCTGPWDGIKGQYRDRTVVFGSLAP